VVRRATIKRVKIRNFRASAKGEAACERNFIFVKEPSQFGGRELTLTVEDGGLSYLPRDFSKALFMRSDLIRLAYRYLKSVWPDVREHAPRVAKELSKLVHEELC